MIVPRPIFRHSATSLVGHASACLHCHCSFTNSTGNRGLLRCRQSRLQAVNVAIVERTAELGHPELVCCEKIFLSCAKMGTFKGRRRTSRGLK